MAGFSFQRAASLISQKAAHQLHFEQKRQPGTDLSPPVNVRKITREMEEVCRLFENQMPETNHHE